MIRVHRALATITVAAIASTCLGQAQVNSGHALDANMQVGSYGYNNRTSSVPLAARNYAPYVGSVNAASQVQNAATNYQYGLRSNTYNTFLNDRYYSPVRPSAPSPAVPAAVSAPITDSSGWQQKPGAPGSSVPPSWNTGATYQQVAPGAYKVDYRVNGGS